MTNSECVEMAGLPGTEISVRNSKDPKGAVLKFTPDEWDAFIGGTNEREFDVIGGVRLTFRHPQGRLPLGDGAENFRPLDLRRATHAASTSRPGLRAVLDEAVLKRLLGDSSGIGGVR